MNRWMIWGGVGVVAVAAALTGVLLLPDADGPPEAKEDAQTSVSYEDYLAEQTRLAELGYDVHTDSDGDGLADVMENFLYGSDPQAFSTTGNGIPDGWFAIYGYDPTVAGVESRPAAVPPTAALPDIYNGYWPDKYRWSLGDVYSYGLADDNGTFHDNGIDPNQWDAPSGLPMAWLVLHEPTDDDWNVTDPDLAEKSPAGDGFTVRANYEHDTDPHVADTDGDGLSDQQEVDRYGTDPNRFSSSGTGVPDGWLVRHELDPLDPRIGSLDPDGKGMTVAEVWQYNAGNFSLAGALAGEGLDPREMSHRGDAVPDGWLVENGLDPLDPDITKSESQCAKQFEDVKHLDEAPEGLVIIPDLCLSVEQAYLHGRPTTWDEKADGPWPGGLDPASGDQDEDGLPDAVEIRGWYVQRFVDVGPGAKGEWIHATSDPLRGDTDGDGLTDHEEHGGEAQREAGTYVFPPTDPSNPDTAFSGMTDAEKVFATIDGVTWPLHEEDGDVLRSMLDPTRRDTAGDYLADGHALAFWTGAADNVAQDRPYTEVYPGSKYATYAEWMEPLVTSDDSLETVMGPAGDIDGDDVPNIIDPSAAGDGLLTGWQVRPETLRFSDFPSTHPRTPIDPANPDTDGDGLPDQWELRHGRWIDALGGWDLDPAMLDSDGDGDGDGDGNIDGDVVLWHSYSDGVATPNEWAFTNILEFKASTNPRVTDETGNGVSEGWVVFWASGQFYDRWVQESESDDDLRELVGDVVPTMEEINAVRGQADGITTPLDPDVGTRVKDELAYFRFVEEPDESIDPSHLDDAFEEEWLVAPEHYGVLREGNEDTARIGIIQGTYRHTFAHDQAWGLNPYLQDTSGDGLRDAWAAHHECGSGIDPTRPSAGLDPDLDGLTNWQEYIRGHPEEGESTPDPCHADTDLDGMTDGDEVLLNEDPLFPGVAAGGDTDDEDGDGLADHEEVGAGTRLGEPDTDRDGLLDGLDRPPGQDTEWAGVWADDYIALGIAHHEKKCPSGDDTRYCFYGEKSNGGDALSFDDRISGIPDGWSVYWNQNEDDGTLQAKYACGKPAWWDPSPDQSLLGVWWWGISPIGDNECPRDRDMDGLDDANGEDPVPAASQSNGQADVDLQDLMADPPTDRLDLVRAAQGWGECAGNPEPCFDAWEQSWQGGTLPDQEPVRIEGLEVTGEGVDQSDRELAKEKDFTVSGTLVLDDGCTPDCTPAPHRTVVVRLAGADPADPLEYDVLSDDIVQDGITLGVGFTDDQGDFSFTGCLCAAGGSIDVPEGHVALGRSNTMATWQTSAADVQVDPDQTWTMGVHAYAGTAAFWGGTDEGHPQYLEVEDEPVGTQPRWKPIDDFTITSGTTLSLDAPDQIAWGDDRTLSVSVELRDASGGPVPEEPVEVRIQGTDIFETLETRQDGTRVFSFDLDGVVGDIIIRASYAGNGGWTSSSVSSSDTVLQAPLDLEIVSAPGNVRLGEPLEVVVRALSQGAVVSEVDVTATLAGLSDKQQTDDEGIATFTLTPTDMDPGPATIGLRAPTTSGHASATADVDISLVSGSTLHANVPEAGALDAPLSVSGHLTLSDGTPLPGEKIQATLAGQVLAQFTTKSDGRFDGAPIVPLDLGIGVHTLRLTYDGEPDAVDAATVEEPVRFSVGTRLGLEEVHAGRGQDALLQGRLTSITGTALVGEELDITLPWNETITVKARSGGNFSQEVAVPADHELGVFQINASYAGSTNGTFGASKIQALLEIGSPSRIEAGPLGVLHRGNNTVTGRLLDDETDAPIVDATIHATPSTGEPLTMQTDDEGRFRFSLSLARDIPGGDIDVAFHYAGDEGYAPAQNTSHGVLRVPARLSIAMPIELGRGTSHDVDVRLTDDRSAPLSTRNVTLSALGATWNATTDTDGNARFALDVPLDTDLGATRISAAYAGDAAHDQAQATREATIKDGVHVNIDGMPDEVLPGQRVTLNIHVEDTSGRPVQTPILVRIDGVPGSLLIETDDLGRAQAPIVVPDTGAEALRITVRFPGTDVLAARTESMQPTLGVATQAAAPTTGWPWMATAAVAAVLVAATAAFVLLRRRRLDATDILQDTEKRITAGDPWAAAVLDAYRRLVELVKSYGIEDDESQTGRAFAQTLVDAGFLHERAARELVALFERARYAGDTMDPADADEARRVLQGTIGAVQRTEAHRGGAPA